MSDPVLYSTEAAVATIAFNRPNEMNSLDVATKEALLDRLRHVADDPAVRCVVITGSGRAFSVGQDLREHVHHLQTMTQDEVWATVDEHYVPIARTIATMAKPVIAAVNGIAAGAGLSIALACDLRIAADSAGFNTSFVGVALSCDTGASWTLPRVVGTAKALDLLLLPRTVSAPEALDLGLVNDVVPAGELAGTVSALAAKLASGPTLAYSSVKRAVAFAASSTLEESLGFESQLMALTGESRDHKHAVESFLSRQRPIFEGE